MTRLKHPYARETYVEVPTEDVERWVAAGWLREEEPHDTDTDPEPTGEDHDHSEENA